MRLWERRIETLEREVVKQTRPTRPFSISEERLEYFRQVTSAYLERFGSKYLDHGKLQDEPAKGSQLEIAKVLIFNFLKVFKALMLLRHWASLRLDREPEETWPEILRNVETPHTGRK